MIRKFIRCVAAALCCLPAVSIAASDDPKELERVLAKIRSDPMTLLLLRVSQMPAGEAAASGSRRRANLMTVPPVVSGLLAVLAKRDMPIFFNSDGGLVSQAVQIGVLLRENRMIAGLARTVPEGCHLGFPLDDACRGASCSQSASTRPGCTSAGRAVGRRASTQLLAPRHAMCGPRRHPSNPFRLGPRGRQGGKFLAALHGGHGRRSGPC
jgi:hypothetical protein